MKKLKVMTVVGTRPELIKLSRVIAELDRQFEHVLVHTGQNFDASLNQVFFDELEIRAPDHYLNVAGGSPAETMGNIIIRADEAFAKERPDALLVYGDTNSCLCVIPAKRRKIPVFHMEAGNRCFDQRVTEEINRKIVDHLSDINLPLTEQARDYLVQEGIRPETIIKTGSTMHEVIAHYLPKVDRSEVLTQLGLKPQGYFVLSAHREENVDSPEKLRTLVESVEALVVKYDKPVIFSTHPRTRKRLEESGLKFDEKKIRSMTPLGLPDYLRLQRESFCVLSDSGTIAEEASLLQFPAVTLRDAHERPEGMDQGTLVMCPVESGRLPNAVEMVTSQFFERGVRTTIVPDYLAENVSVKIARIILSYVDYVNRTVWKR